MTYIHIHAPAADSVLIIRCGCPTCKRRTYMLSRHVPWYGSDDICLRCGEEWQDGERSERPFAPKWRPKNIERARGIWRRWQPSIERPKDAR